MESIQQMVTSAPQMENSANTVANALGKPRAAASRAAGGSTAATSSSTSSTSATISANDFLTLLVAEMKNQDPTQPTDPNQYITQMVDVNSLQQLIGINQGVSSLDTAARTSTTGASTSLSGTGATE